MHKQVLVKVILDDLEYVDVVHDAPVPTWISGNIGSRGQAWDYREDPHESYFEFYSEGDAELFLIRWQGQIQP
ncbi:hypothetical protein EWE75_01325 [Sphingomonas populi]|uniref:Uncharacterized protein n=1 Tax=Sphingomonas populi TaxID=2484750 RepID=A0A4Q6Y801_9SPHN|nr:hypothetical protein [Sphingomonas populi]RZF66522.1 hypothetical protein EWE75_01325 [Sphingomonas populi]